MKSPFTDFTGIASDEYQSPGMSYYNNATEKFTASPIYGEMKYLQPEAYEPYANIPIEGELTDAERAQAQALNAGFMVSLGWSLVLNEVIAKLKTITGIDAKDSYTKDINYGRLADAIDRYQEMKGLKPTNKGVMGIGTWSTLQDDMGLLKYDKYKTINIDKAAKANRHYKNTLWGKDISYIIRYFTALGLLRFPVDDKYFATIVAEWQRTDPKMKLIPNSADGILGKTSWDILQTNIEHMFPAYKVIANKKLVNTEEAARRFVVVMKDLGDGLVRHLDTIDNQLGAYLANEKLEYAMGREAFYLGLNSFLDIASSFPPTAAPAIISRFVVGLVKRYYDVKAENDRRQAVLSQTISVSDMILKAKNNATYLEDERVIKKELDDQLKAVKLAHAKSGNAEKAVQDELNNYFNFISQLEETVRDNSKIFRMSLSQLITMLSHHTRIIVECQNKEEEIIDWNEGDLKNILNDPGRKRLHLRFTSIHPNVNVVEDPITASKRKVLNFIWKIWVNNGFAVKDLLVDKEVYFGVTFFRSVGNFFKSQSSFFHYLLYIGTIDKNKASWTDTGDILGRVGNMLQFKNGTDILTKGIDETNTTGRLTYRQIILTIVNTVMKNEYNTWSNSSGVGYSESETPENEFSEETVYDNYNEEELDTSLLIPNTATPALPQANSYLSKEKVEHATSTNIKQVTKSQILVSDILASLAKSVNIPSILQYMLDFNRANSGNPYKVNTNAGSVVDAVFTEAVHQFQIANFLNPKEHDGVLGQSTLDTLGFVNHGLKAHLNSGSFYGQGILNHQDIKSQVPGLSGNEFTAANWYGGIMKPAWLGVKITDGIHILLLRKLKQAEQWLLSQPAYKGMTPAALGRAMGFTADTRYSGARLSSGKQAMHGFGLALDINVNGNPWIGAGWVRNDKTLLQERYRMIKAFRNASPGQTLPGDTVFEYLHHIAQTAGNDTRIAFNALKQRHDSFIQYLQQQSAELAYWKRSQTFDNRNPLKGFLNLHADLVYALRQVAGLAWGAIDFGPRASGDIMHFDLRTIGVGKFLCEKIGGYVPKNGHPVISNTAVAHEWSFENGEDSTAEAELVYHEAIEEADWEEPELSNQEINEEAYVEDTNYFS